ncbi:autotransporter outer membrane beta-barrel domain-containing protein [Phyllobacterium ifriqiyense]|nr:autotransporter domain-containing protein [Phyllobacterium ifriqiyense]
MEWVKAMRTVPFERRCHVSLLLSEKTTLTAHGMVGWNHAMGDVTVTGQHAFAGGGNFAIQGLPIAKDALNVEAGIDIDIGKSTRLGIKYTGQFSQQSRDNAVKANLSLRF